MPDQCAEYRQVDLPDIAVIVPDKRKQNTFKQQQSKV
jgi:hypothetical protein